VSAGRLVSALALGITLFVALPCHAGPQRLAVLDDIRIDGPVQGDVVAFGGNVILGPEARVEGHAVAVLGRVVVAPGAEVSGEEISVTSLAGLELGGVASEVSQRLRWGVRLLTWGFWLLAVSLLAALFPSRTVRGVWMVRRAPAAALGLGIVAALTFMAALVGVLSAGPALGLPGALALLLFFGAGKLLGIALIGGTIGGWMLRWTTGRRFPIPFDVALGVTLLLLVRMVPAVGGALWALASLWGLGAAVVALAADPLRQLSRAPLNPGD